MSVASAGTSDSTRTKVRRQHVDLVASLDGFGVDAASHAVGDLQRRQRDVLAEQVLADDPQPVLVLEEPVIGGPQVGAVGAADDIERRQLQGVGSSSA